MGGWTVKVKAANLRTGDHIESHNGEFRVLSSERSGDMMWMITGYVVNGSSRNIFASPDDEFTVLKRDVPYSPEFG
jgi:hypothetical protein